jgi:hypothetical protein
MSEPFVVVEMLSPFRDEEKPGDSAAVVELRRKDVEAALGLPDAFEPHAPENSRSFASCIYKVGARSLWFELGREDKERVISISIHPAQDLR